MSRGEAFEPIAYRVEAHPRSPYGGTRARLERYLVESVWRVEAPARRALYVPSSIDPGATVLVASLRRPGGWGYVGPEFVGCAALLTAPSVLADALFFGVGGDWPELSQVWVHERYRGAGVADDLVRAALEVADASGIEQVNLVCGPHFAPWYERHGFARSTFCGRPFPEAMLGGQRPYVHMYRDRPEKEESGLARTEAGA